MGSDDVSDGDCQKFNSNFHYYEALFYNKFPLKVVGNEK
jgi:hypothetical protein